MSGVKKAHEENAIKPQEAPSGDGKPKFEIRKKESYPALAFIMEKQGKSPIVIPK